MPGICSLLLGTARALRTPGSETPAAGVQETPMTSQPGMLSVFASGKMLAIRDMVARIAATRAPVLIRGEEGVGKELLARAIHAASPRADKQFIKVNCAMFAPDVLDAELVGHEKGAFSGAARLKPGKLETAHQGTLLIEEISDMP